MKLRTSQESARLVAQIEKLRQDGMSTQAACDKVGMGYSTYGYHKKRLANEPQVMITSLPTNPEKKRPYNKSGKHQKPSGKMAVIIGTRADVLEVLNEYF